MPENEFVLRIDNGEDIIKKIEEFAKQNEIEFGYFTAGNGTIRDFELVSIENKGGVTKNKFREESDLRAVSGKIEKNRLGKPDINLRVSVGLNSLSNKSGQLASGKAGRALEISIKKVNMKKIIGA